MEPETSEEKTDSRPSTSGDGSKNNVTVKVCRNLRKFMFLGQIFHFALMSSFNPLIFIFCLSNRLVWWETYRYDILGIYNPDEMYLFRSEKRL